MILQKLQQAREAIKSSNLKKAGWNDYSKYWYYTPEQINQLVYEAEKKIGLMHTFNLVRNEFGLEGLLTITDLETKENITFTQATDIPSIKATNVAQQIGGAVTYTNRYMLMTAFDISDNSLDFDHDNGVNDEKPEAKKTKWLPDSSFNNMVSLIENKAKTVEEARKITHNSGFTFSTQQEEVLAEWEAATND